MSSNNINAQTCQYCFLDLDLDNARERLATAAAFVDATDTRYGFSSNILLKLGGSELSRLPELISTDHEWSTKTAAAQSSVVTKPPAYGNRIVVKLYWDIAPLACENFATLCANGSSSASSSSGGKSEKVKPPPIGESGKPLTYRGSTVHRVIPGFIMQGGDFVFGNGSGGECVFSGKKTFKDERGGLNLGHDRRGILSMGNSGKNSNTSQFFFTFDKANQCDGKHVIFGEIVSGYGILDACEQLGTKDGNPTSPITITDCGIFKPLDTPGNGFWYDAPDADSYSGISSLFIVRPRIAIVAPSSAVIQKFKSAMTDKVSVVGEIATDVLTEVSDQQQQLMNYLNRYQADTILVAPACKASIESMELPSSWLSSSSSPGGISLKEVVLVSKPIDAMTKIASESWLNCSKRASLQFEHNL